MVSNWFGSFSSHIFPQRLSYLAGEPSYASCLTSTLSSSPFDASLLISNKKGANPDPVLLRDLVLCGDMRRSRMTHMGRCTEVRVDKKDYSLLQIICK